MATLISCRSSQPAKPLAHVIMRTIFGAKYGPGADLLQIVILGLPAYAGLGVCWYAVVAFDGEARLVRIGLIGLAVSVLLAALLIPSGGDEGAARQPPTICSQVTVSARGCYGCGDQGV